MSKSLDDYETLDEDRVRHMAATTGSGKNTFIDLLEIHRQWKEAGCTPVFIMAHETDDRMVLGCVAKETFGQWLN